MPGSKKNWKTIRAILKSLGCGATHFAACKAAGINDSSWWNWKKADPRLDALARKVLNTRIQFVEDALFKTALEGSVQAQKYFLNNRCNKDWREAPDVVVMGDDNSRHFTQIFQQAPARIIFDDGDGDRKTGIEVAPEDCAASPREELVPAGERIEACQENRLP